MISYFVAEPVDGVVRASKPFIAGIKSEPLDCWTDGSDGAQYRAVHQPHNTSPWFSVVALRTSIFLLFELCIIKLVEYSVYY